MKDRIRSDLVRYLSAHQNKTNLRLHYWAFLCAFLAWVCLTINVKWTIVLALLHYLLSWIGHYYFEGNRPAMFRYPWIGFYIGFLWFFVRSFELITRREVLDLWIRKKP